MKYELGLPGMYETFRFKKNAAFIFGRYLSKCIRSRNCIVFVAEEKGRIVAYSLNMIKKEIPVFANEKTGYMSDLFVDEKFRGFGIASKFRKLAFQWFSEKGLKYASKLVYAPNRKAHGIYNSWGFVDCHIELRKKVS